MGDEEGGAFPEIGANSAGREKGNLDAKAANAALDDKRLGSTISLPLNQLIHEAKIIEKNAFAPQIPSFDFHTSPSLPEQPFEQMEFNSAFAIAMRMEGASKKRGSIISTAPPVKEDGGIEQELKVFGKIPSKDAGSEIGMSPQQASHYLPQKSPGIFSSFLQKLKFTKKKKPNIAPPPFTPLAPASKAQRLDSPPPTSWQPSTSTPLAQKFPTLPSSHQKTPALQAENSQQMQKKKLFGIFGAKKTIPPKQEATKEGLTVSSSPSYSAPISQEKNKEEPIAKEQFTQEKNIIQQGKPGSPPKLPGIYSDKHYSQEPAQMPKPSQKLRQELEQVDPKQKAKAFIFGGLGTPPKKPFPTSKSDAGDDDNNISDEGGMRTYDESDAEKTQNAGFSSPIITPKPGGREVYSSQSVSQMGESSSSDEKPSFAEASEGAGKMRDAEIKENYDEEEEGGKGAAPQKRAQEKGASDFGLSALSNALKAATGSTKEKKEIAQQPKTPAAVQSIQQKKTPKPRLRGYETPSDAGSISPITEIETHYSSQASAVSSPAKKVQIPQVLQPSPKKEPQEKTFSAKKGETLKFSQKSKVSPPPQKQKPTEQKEIVSSSAQKSQKQKISASQQPKQPAKKTKVSSPAKESEEQEEENSSSLDELEQAAGELGGEERRKEMPSQQKGIQPSSLANRLGISSSSQKQTPVQAKAVPTTKKVAKPAQENDGEEAIAPSSARKNTQRPAQQEDENEDESGDEGAIARKKMQRPAQQEDEDDDEGEDGGAHAVSSRISQKADDILSAPQKKKEKESESKNDDIMFAYAKERHKWVYEIYKMGGMTLEEFRSKMNEKMSQDDSDAKGEKKGENEKDNSAFSNLDSAANKKFKK